MSRLKVLHITIGDRWAGVATHLCNLLPALKDQGADVSCMVFSRTLLSDRLAERGIEVKILERRRKYDVGVLKQIGRFLRDSSVDIIHMHGYMAIIYGCLASLLWGRARKIVTFHQPSEPFREIKDLKFRYSLISAYRLAHFMKSRFIAVSREVLESYRRNYKFSSNLIDLIYNGIEFTSLEKEVSAANLRESLGIPSDCVVVSIVGRLDRIKGHVYFIESASQLRRRFEKIVFLIIGEGELRDELTAIVRREKLEDCVRFLGFQKDIQGIFEMTDVLVVSSLFEGIPYTLLEAMSLGVKVVATEVGGLPELIESRKDGVLVEPRSPTAITNAVTEILEDGKLADKLSQNAKEKIRSTFSAGKMAEETLAVYKRMAANS